MINEKYSIRFSSLKDGLHEFSYQLGKEFFEHIEYSEIKEAEIDVHLFLEKKSTMMILNFDIEGKVKVMCDRCTDDFFLDIDTSEELIYRFGDEDMGDEKVIVIYPNEIDIDLTHPMYEFITLALPSRRLHKDGECNKDMLKEINNYLLIEEDSTKTDSDISNSKTKEIDPRWSALNKLKNK